MLANASSLECPACKSTSPSRRRTSILSVAPDHSPQHSNDDEQYNTDDDDHHDDNSTPDEDMAGKFARRSAEFMEQTTNIVFKSVKFLNCSPTSHDKSMAGLVDSVIQVPSQSSETTTVYSEMTQGSAKMNYVCEGALSEWIKELDSPKRTREREAAVQQLRRATLAKRAAAAVARNYHFSESHGTQEPRYEHQGMVFARSDTDLDCLPPPVYSTSLF